MSSSSQVPFSLFSFFLFFSLLSDIFDFDSSFHNYLSTAVRSNKHERDGRFDA